MLANRSFRSSYFVLVSSFLFASPPWLYCDERDPRWKEGHANEIRTIGPPLSLRIKVSHSNADKLRASATSRIDPFWTALPSLGDKLLRISTETLCFFTVQK